MTRQLVRDGNRVTIELEESELEKLGVGEMVEVDVAIEDGALVVTPVENEAGDDSFDRAAEKVNARYAGLFRRLSK
jgi:antitoxin component of MazEF toxin-antitoxin module